MHLYWLPYAALCCAMAFSNPAGAALTYQTVAVANNGNPAPGLPNASLSQFAYGPVINDAGQVSFTSLLGSNNSAVTYLGTPGHLAVVAVTDQQAPGFPSGSKFLSLGAPFLDNNGLIAFAGSASGSPNVGAVWIGTPGHLSVLLKVGDTAPGASATFGGSYGVSAILNSNNQWVGIEGLSGSFDPAGVFTGTIGSTPALVARSGGQAPGAPAGVTFATFGIPGFSSSGQTVFRATLGGTATSGTAVGIWAGMPGNLSLIARAGSQAVGLPAGETYYDFTSGNDHINRPRSNASGQIVFSATVVNPGNPFVRGVWEGAPNAISLVAKSGDVISGPTGSAVLGNETTTLINNSGTLALTDGYNIFTGTAGHLRAAVVGGQSAPGVSGHFTNIFDMRFNDLGQITFTAYTDNASTGSQLGIWYYDPVAGLNPVDVPGQVFSFEDGATGTTFDASFVGSQNIDSGVTALNNKGQFTFQYYGSPGEQRILLVQLPVSTPEPSSLVMLALLAGGLGFMRTRSRRFPFAC